MFFKKKSFSNLNAPEWLIAGLGNPGAQYENTRHNAGFLALDLLAGEHSANIKRIRFKSLCGDCCVDGVRCLLLKPQTFMNHSGEAVRDAMAFYKLPPERVLLLFDDISLPPGKIRVRPFGTDGGHNGLKSIFYLTGSDRFPRVKIGVGEKPRPDFDLAAWVLSRFSPEEAALVKASLTRTSKAAALVVGGELTKAMNLYN
ncbi:MAG: aminoacyl-tRNA hydrolase [Oscillospiraceae bacterium]|nr:aminoacyl-tRNA hydrolase [Oscillospiraceae bacterium]